MRLHEAHEVLEKKLFNLTFSAASNPWTTILSVIGLTAIFTGGFFSDNFVVESKMENLYVPLDSRAYESLQYLSKHFGQEYNELILVHATNLGDNILTKHFFDSLWDLYDAIYEIEIDKKTYIDFCTVAGDGCFTLSPLGFWEDRTDYNETVFDDEDILTSASAPPFADGTKVNRNFLFAKHVATGSDEDDDFKLVSAQGAQMYFPLNDFRITEKQAPEFEISLLEVCGVTGVPFAPVVNQLYDHITVRPLASRTVDDELLRIIFIDSPLIVIEYILMFFYTTACLSIGTGDEVRVFATTAGMCSVLLSTFAGYGLCAYIGVPFTSMTMVLPFILVGIGVDDMFIIIHTFRYVSGLKEYKDESIPFRIGKAVEKCGLSIVYTTTTDVVAFALGSWSSIPSIEYFCTYAAFSVLFDFLFQITFFIACFSIDEQRITRNKVRAQEEQDEKMMLAKEKEIHAKLKQGRPLMPSIHERSEDPPQPLLFTTPAVLVLSHIDQTNVSPADCFHEALALTYGDDIFQTYLKSSDFAYWFNTVVHGAVPVRAVKQLWQDSVTWLRLEGQDGGSGGGTLDTRMDMNDFCKVIEQWRIQKSLSLKSGNKNGLIDQDKKTAVMEGGAADNGQIDDSTRSVLNQEIMIGQEQRINPLLNHPSSNLEMPTPQPIKEKEISTFEYFTHKYVMFADTRIGKVIVLSFFAALTSFAFYSSLQIEEKFDGAMVMPDVSYATEFFRAAEDLEVFWDYEFPFNVVFRDIEIGDPENQKNMLNLMESLTDKKRIRGPSTFWLEEFLSWCEFDDICSNHLNEDGYFEGKTAGEKDGVKLRNIIHSFLQKSAFEHYKSDIIFRDIIHNPIDIDDDRLLADGSVINGSKLVIVSRGTLNHLDIFTSSNKVEAMVNGYDACKENPLGIEKAFTYSTIYIFVTQFQVIFGQTVLNLLLCLVAVGVVSIFTLESIRGVFILLLTIGMMDFALLGCIPVIDEHLNLITMICLIMAIGLMVDYLAHIMHYACIASPAPTSGPAAQVATAVGQIGPSVLLGASTTLIGVMPLGFASSYIFRIFFKMFMATILLALLHAFFFLPVMLIVFPVQIQASVHPTSEVLDTPEESAARAGAAFSFPRYSSLPSSPSTSSLSSSISSSTTTESSMGMFGLRFGGGRKKPPMMPRAMAPARNVGAYEEDQEQRLVMGPSSSFMDEAIELGQLSTRQEEL